MEHMERRKVLIQYFLFGSENYALTRAAVLLGESLEIIFDGAACEGTLYVGKNEVKVREGKCRFPVSFLCEGENCLIYMQKNGNEIKRFTLEPLHKWGDMAGVKPLEGDRVSLSLLAHIRYLKGALSEMQERVARLETCCLGSPLLDIT